MNDITRLGDAIIRSHNGKVFYNLKEASKILGCGQNLIAGHLHASGLTAKKQGRGKYVTAYDLAEYMLRGRTSLVNYQNKFQKAR